jgi:hypothetical protein
LSGGSNTGCESADKTKDGDDDGLNNNEADDGESNEDVKDDENYDTSKKLYGIYRRLFCLILCFKFNCILTHLLKTLTAGMVTTLGQQFESFIL